MWPQVLQVAHRHPNSFRDGSKISYFIIHAINRALYHTGRLGYEMFAYPQPSDALLLNANVFEHRMRADTYIDLGLMNMAEHTLTHCLETLGEHPIVLKRLALVDMVKGNIGAARIYLGALGKTFFHADWANSYLKKLESDPNLSTDQQIQRLRTLMMVKDCDFSSLDFENTFSALLQKNSQNRMAFEYLMAWYLLTDQLEKLVQNLDQFVAKVVEESLSKNRCHRLYFDVWKKRAAACAA